jgi:hypothetical protein
MAVPTGEIKNVKKLKPKKAGKRSRSPKNQRDLIEIYPP